MKKIFLLLTLLVLVLPIFSQEMSWVPKPVKIGDYEVKIGFNEPGEMATDARDLRIKTNDNKFIEACVGRMIFFANDNNMSYATPSNFPFYTYKEGDKTIWVCSYIDNRSGIYQKNKFVIDGENVTAYLGIKFLKDISGNLELQVIFPEDNVSFSDLTNKLKTAEYTLGDKKYYFTLQSEGNFSFGRNHWGFNHLIRRMCCFGSIRDQGDFKAGEEKTYVLNVNLKGKKVFPLYEEIDFDKDFSIVHSDIKDNKTYIPNVIEPLVFLPNDKKQISFNVYNFGNKKQSYPIKISVRDYDNKIVLRSYKTLNLDKNTSDYAIFDLSKLPYGLYSCYVTCKDQNICRRFAVIRDPVEISAKDSMFGFQSFMFNNNDTDVDFVSKLGCHFLRIGHAGVWNGNEDAFKKYAEKNIDYCFTLIHGDLEKIGTFSVGDGIYEILNEPDGEMKNDEYVNVYKEHYDKIKSLDPGKRIMGPNVSGGDSDGGFPLSKNFINSGVDFDYLCIHPYSAARVIGEGLEPFSPERNSLYEKLTDIASVSPKPVIIGEYGFTMLCQYRFPEEKFGQYEKQFAHYMARSYLIAKMVPKVEKYVHFFISPEKLGLIQREPAQYGPYNMLGAENNPEPMLGAYATLAVSTDGSEFVEKLSFDDPNIWGLVTKRGEEYFVALWSAKGNYELKINKLENAIHRSFVGTDTNFNSNIIEISEEPFYILTKDISNIEKIKNGKLSKIIEKAKKNDYSNLDISWHCKHNSKPIVIDGDLSEWDDLPIILNEQTQIMPPDPGKWKGPQDLSARIGSKYDDKYLYIAVEVTDDYHNNTNEPGTLWKEDSLQISIANVYLPLNNVELNVGASTITKPTLYPTLGRTKPLENYKCEIKRVGDKTIYEFAIGFDEFPDITLGKGQYCRLALIVNDVDELGIRRWTGVKDPVYICGTKEPNNYPVMKFE